MYVCACGYNSMPVHAYMSLCLWVQLCAHVCDVCLCLGVRACMVVCACGCSSVPVHVCACIRVSVCMCVRACACAPVRVPVRARACVRVSVCTCVHAYLCPCICVHAYMCLCACVCMEALHKLSQGVALLNSRPHRSDRHIQPGACRLHWDPGNIYAVGKRCRTKMPDPLPESSGSPAS